MILNRQRAVRVARRPLELCLARVRRELGIVEADVTICFVSDAEMARMNQSFRKKKGPTDVLSFPAIHRRVPVSLPQRLKAGAGRPPPTKVFLGDVPIPPPPAGRHPNHLARSL